MVVAGFIANKFPIELDDDTTVSTSWLLAFAKVAKNNLLMFMFKSIICIYIKNIKMTLILALFIFQQKLYKKIPVAGEEVKTDSVVNFDANEKPKLVGEVEEMVVVVAGFIPNKFPTELGVETVTFVFWSFAFNSPFPKPPKFIW